jgi:hypothetical protein
MALPSQFSALSPESNAIIDAQIKAQRSTLTDDLSGSADFQGASTKSLASNLVIYQSRSELSVS